MFSALPINGPFGDPGVYVEFKYRREAILFDLGDLSVLPPRKILKISHIFVSHTHMDHFIGFDHLLRICLGRDQHIALFGPPDFLEKVESKLRAYSWNLVANYTNDLELSVTEVHDTHMITRRYRCRTAFRPEDEKKLQRSDAVLAESDFFVVKGLLLDHGIPCLAFRFEEKTRLNIKSNILREMGLPTGAWLTAFKNQIIRHQPEETPVRAWWKNPDGAIEETFLSLGMLKERAVKITHGQIVCYVTDVRLSEENVRKIIELAGGAELLFIEAPFLQVDAGTAARKYHLTAFQAGALGALAGVKRISFFHFSPKYRGREERLEKEAQESFRDKKHLDNPGGIL